MSRTFRIQEPNVLYHVINRGSLKQRLFFNHWDYWEFLDLIKKYKQKFSIKLYHYVLMPNHIHFLLEPTIPHTLSSFMQGLTLAYARRFNQRKEQTGHVWQGRFKNIPITDDAYFLQCGQYIELNPVRANLVSNPTDYPWSSYGSHASDTRNPLVDQHPLYLALGSIPEIRRGEYKKLIEQHI